jgi:hypothetical protein
MSATNATAREQSPLVAFPHGNGRTWVYFLAHGDHVEQLLREADRWRAIDLNAAAEDDLRPTHDTLVGFLENTEFPQVFYIDPEDRIQQLRWDGNTWVALDVSSDAQAPSAVPGSPLTGFLQDDQPRLYYVGAEGHIHELARTVGGWFHTDITQTGDLPSASTAALSSFGLGSADRRVYYLTEPAGTEPRHVVEARSTDLGWAGSDLTATVGTDHPPVDDSPLLAFAVDTDDPRVYYLDDDRDVWQFWWSDRSNGWRLDKPGLAAKAPSAAKGSDLSGFNLSANRPRVYYQDSVGHLIELRWTDNGWTHFDISELAQGAPRARNGSRLASFDVDAGPKTVFYFADDGRVQQLHYTNQWTWSQP